MSRLSVAGFSPIYISKDAFCRIYFVNRTEAEIEFVTDAFSRMQLITSASVFQPKVSRYLFC